MNVKTIKLKKTILENNDRNADLMREELKQDGTYYMNIMSSPGSGKTTALVETIKRLQQISGLKIGVMEADIDSDVDAKAIAEQTGVPAVQLYTGGMCHLDADMSRQGLKGISSKELDLVFLENVGNLVCPAEFDTGAVKSVAILSVPEGDDKPLKYPLMFEEVDTVLVSKIDAMPAFDFDVERFKKNLAECNDRATVFLISAITGEGIDEWCQWLYDEVAGYLKEV
ncbi:MAG: hydrogenase nickel incorporation protein HypB [Lentihominibacter sp.]